MMKKVFNWSELHLSEVISYKILILVDARINASEKDLLVSTLCSREVEPFHFQKLGNKEK